MKRVLVVVLLAIPAIARADNPSLVRARAAIAEVRYDDARRDLVDALGRGGNRTDELLEIYRLSAATAVVLGEIDLAEAYYRRILALDPAQTLSADDSPRLREPFVAAQAYMAARPRLAATPVWRDATLEVTVVDPLGMVAAIGTLDGGKVVGRVAVGAAAASGTAVVIPDPGAGQVLLDEYGNWLRRLRTPPAPPRPGLAPWPSAPAPTDRPATQSLWRRPLTWAVPALAAGAGAAYFFVDARRAHDRLDDILADPASFFFQQAEEERRRWRNSTYLGWGLAAVATGFTVLSVATIGGDDASAGAVVLGPGPTPAGLTLSTRY